MYTAIGMSCAYVDWLLATVNPWIRVADWRLPLDVLPNETHCTREEREIRLDVSLKMEDGVVMGTFHYSKE